MGGVALGGRRRVAILFGGQSQEHEVSVLSAAAVYRALDPRRYERVAVGITPAGHWLWVAGGPEAVGPQVAEGAGRPLHLRLDGGGFVTADGTAVPLDLVFPVLHGPCGEDGKVQGLLELAGLPYVGSGVLGSAAGMDKGVMKALFRERGLPVVRHRVVSRHRLRREGERVRAELAAELGFPLFVKPANLGSSVGISKVRAPEELPRALELAARYDRRLVVEEGLTVREIEVAVLGNDEPQVSAPGEAVPAAKFYDYRAKYQDEALRLLIPAPLTPEQTREARRLALEAFRAVDAAGLARVDLFWDRGAERFLVNEINTLPGITAMSLFPKLWEAEGIPFAAVVERLVALAEERWREMRGGEEDFPAGV